MSQPLVSYQDIHSATLSKGKPLHITMDFNQCTPNFNMRAYLRPNAIIATDSFIAFSDDHLTTHHPKFPNQLVREHVSYKLTDDGTVSISVEIINPTDNKMMANTHTLTCQLNNGFNFYTND